MAPTWKTAEGKKDVKARVGSTGHRNPDLKDGSVDTPVCACPRSSYPQVLSSGAREKWVIWSLDIKTASPRAAGFQRVVLLCVPGGRGLAGAHRFWKLRGPAYGLNNAPAAFRKSLQRHLRRAANSEAPAGLELSRRRLALLPLLFSV